MQWLVEQAGGSQQRPVLLGPDLGMRAARHAVVAEVVANLHRADGHVAADQVSTVDVGNVQVVFSGQKPLNNWKTRGSSPETAGEIAEIIGTEALRFALLRVSADKPMLLELDTWLTCMERNPLFCLQFAHSQLVGVIQRGGQFEHSSIMDSVFKAPEPLAVLLADEQHYLSRAAKQRAPDVFIRYLVAVGQAWNAISTAHLFPSDDGQMSPELTNQLTLLASAKHVLSNGLSLLGISAPERL